MMYRVALTLLLVAVCQAVCAQRMVADTIHVKFAEPPDYWHGLIVDSVVDRRGEPPRLIAVNEIKKYLYVPLDQLVLIENPLADGVKDIFRDRTDSLMQGEFWLAINEFTVLERKFFSTSYVTCEAAISVYSQTHDDDGFQGVLVYDTSMGKRRISGKKAEMAYEAIIKQWSEDLVMDLTKLAVCPPKDPNCFIPNLLPSTSLIRTNMMPSLEFFLGYDSWLLDGEIIFARPEGSQWFMRRAYSLRYRHEEKFQSIQFTIDNSQYHTRINRNYLLGLKSKLFMGFNRWSEEEYPTKDLLDALIFDYSPSGHLLYNPLHLRGFTAGAGVMGSLTYINALGLKVRPFFSVQMGLKF